MSEIFLMVGILIGNTELTDVVESITSVVVTRLPFTALLIKPALNKYVHSYMYEWC